MADKIKVISQQQLSNYGTDASGNPGTAGVYIKLRRETSEGWDTSNPIPKQGEPCAELLSNGAVALKVGNGVLDWQQLAYAICAVDDGELG